jgi:hypothetical protein
MKMRYILFLIVVPVILVQSQSQSKLLKDFTAKSLIPASVADGKLTIKNKEWPVEIESDNGVVNKIKLMRAGVLEENYQPDVPAYSSYFYTPDNRICYLNDVFIYYKMVSGEPQIGYVLASNAEKLQSLDPAKLKSELMEYFSQVSVEQRGAKESFKGDLALNKEKEKLANSIKGKNIKSLEIQWLTPASQTGMQSKIQFGIKAVDDKGTVFSTDNLGGKTPWEDFIITSKGAVPGDEYLTVETDAALIPNDIVSVQVKSKHHQALVTSSTIKLSYSTPVKLAFTGKHGCPPLVSGTGTSGGYAADAELNICNSKDNEFVLIEVKVSGNATQRVKLKKGVAFYFDISGGGGCSGRGEKSQNGGKGGNGGDGGNLTINKDPKLQGEVLNLYNYGGKGGKGGSGKPYDGPAGNNGRDGKQTINIKPIQLNF